MDEGTGSTTKDDAASHTGTITGATWKTESDGCPSGNCLYFDGDDYVATPAFALSGTVLTVTGWVKMASNETFSQYILGEGTQSETVGFIGIWINKNSINSLYWVYANGSVVVSPNMTTFFTGYDNVWVHFAIVADYSGALIKWYRNGELIQTSAMTGTPLFPSTNRIKYLGAYNASSHRITNGNLDDIRIYNRELSASEIKAIYEGTK
jgi:hypothetical protein